MSLLATTATEPELGPAKLDSLAHVSLPCRDLEDAIAFYVDVLGGELRVNGKSFASVTLAGIHIGIGNVGCTFMGPSTEYPHLAFYLGPDELLHTRAWLAQCGIPMSNMWTRRGTEVLSCVRDPSGNGIEWCCKEGIKDADKLRRGPSRGHGTAVDIDSIQYNSWKRPKQRGSRIDTPGRGD